VLYVESAPGRIKEVYDFAEEEELVLANTGAKKFVKLTSPTRGELKAALTKVKPDIVHLAGVDTHQGFTLLKDDRAPDAHDGYLLAGPGATVDPVDAESLAKIIAAAPPALVVCNLWNSAARVSAMLVAVGGAGAALGFQDSFDDGLAQLMLGSFYAALSTEVLEEAFATGWKALRGHSTRLRGTGIALWQGGAPRRTTRRRCRGPRPTGRGEGPGALVLARGTTARALFGVGRTTAGNQLRPAAQQPRPLLGVPHQAVAAGTRRRRRREGGAERR
jgi:hypothetical protein